VQIQLDAVEDKAGFEEMLTTLDVSASAIRNPTCIGKLSRREPPAVWEQPEKCGPAP
jgi:5-methyltetrahydropteroyltriglutamate--homocysteine methyltransferase